MKLRQAFKMAMKSISSKKARSFLTMLGIIIGIASVMTIVSTVNGMNKKSLEYYESLGTNRINIYAYRYDGVNMFDDIYDYCLKLGDLVEGVTPDAYVYGKTVVYGSKTTEGVNMAPELRLGSDQYSKCNNFTISSGRDLSYLDIKDYNQVCVMGARAAEFFFNYRNPIGETITVSGVPFTVIGVYEAKDPDSEYSLDNIIVFPYTASRAISTDTQFSDFVIKAKDSASINKIITRIDGFLSGIISEGNGSYYAYSDNQWMNDQSDQANMMSLVLGGIAFISLLVGGIGIMNIMLVTVTERTREIGIRRAIGAERATIVTQFLIEAATICGIGGIFGILLGFGGTLIAGKALVKMTIVPSAQITFAAFAFSVVLGIIFGLYPAIKASGLQPVVALKAE